MTSTEKFVHMSFNQDCSYLEVGTSEGYQLYLCDPSSTYSKCFETKNGGMGLVSMLNRTSLVAAVGAGLQSTSSPRILQLFNTSEQSLICELNFPSTILNVKLNSKRLVVVLETKIHVFDILTMKVLTSIDTPMNPKGLVALSSAEGASYLAYPYAVSPGSLSGDVILVDATSFHKVSVLNAHATSLECLSISADGTRLATASSKGTVICVFDVPSCKMIASLRRGTNSAQIFSLAFDASATFLAVASDRPTIHIFKIVESKWNREGRSAGSISDTFSNMVESARDFAHFKLRSKGTVKNICGIAPPTADGCTRVLVATYDGFLYQYMFETAKGGECKLEHEHRL